MKTKFLLLAALTISMIGFAQKDEIKTAKKALDEGNSAAAKTALESAASSIDGADEKMQAEYHLLRGKAYADLANKGDATAYKEAADSYKKVVSIEEQSGKQKFSEDAQTQIATLEAELINSAIKDTNEQRIKEGVDKLYLSYTLSPTDTIRLFYAASYSLQAGEFEDALKYYQELSDMGYDGSGVIYKATNAETGEVEEFGGDKVQRDILVKSGTYNTSLDEKTPSKRPEVVANLAKVHYQLGNKEKALEAYQNAREKYPEDVNLVIGEANIHFEMGNRDKFKELISQATEMAPENAVLWYNIGTVNMEQGNLEEAREALRKSIDIDPKNVDAYGNLANTYLNEGNALLDEMNVLGNSRADAAKYDELKNQKEAHFLDAAKVLEEALVALPDNQVVLSQLRNIYGALGDNDNFMRIKKMMGEEG